VATRDGVHVLAAGQEVAGDALAAGWVVLFRADAQQRDVPRLLFLSRRPSVVRLTDALELDFANSKPTQLYAGSLYGLAPPGRWHNRLLAAGLPDDVTRRAERLTQLFVGFREQCTEAAVPEVDSVLITDRFERPSSAQEWGVQPEAVAPIPPILALVLQHGYPAQVARQLVDLEFPTKYGPLMDVRGDTVQYRLPLPPRDHYGVIPVDGYWWTLNWYTPKALIRYRREPFTGLDYASSFIWPMSFRDGVRYFTGENESASVILYCMEMYAHYYGNWTTIASNWHLVPIFINK
jgi:hypothetical protein